MPDDSWIDGINIYSFESGDYGEYSESDETKVKTDYISGAGESNFPDVSLYDFINVPSTVDPPASNATPTRYRMRGYFVAGSTYEFWVTTSPSSPNPSGNPLVSVTVDSILSQ